MSRSLIQTTNTTSSYVALNGTIPLGSVLRRFGCNCRLNGNKIEIEGTGYYTVTATVSLQPEAAGAVSVALYENNVAVPSAVATGTAAAIGDDVTLTIVTTVRETCCEGASSLALVLTEGPSTVTNVSLRVEKE